MNANASPRPSTQLAQRVAFGSMALLSGGLAVWLAWHYPLGGVIALLVALALGAAMVWQPRWWLVLVPAALPLVGWAPWSGWLTFEEFDILLLTAAAAGYGRMAYTSYRVEALRNIGQSAIKSGAIGGFLVGLLALSVLWSLGRGFADAGGFVFGWFQGYHEPMNSVRLAKSLFLALLLWPLWRATSQAGTAMAAGRTSSAALLAMGMALGMVGVSLTTVWERLAFTDLLNFAADYRTIGMFWEMHVGGAALDGYLALTMPFAVQQLLVARKPLHVAGAVAALGLGVYASLTTFSRGVYLALPLGVAVMLWLQTRWQGRLDLAMPTKDASSTARAPALWAGLVAVILYTLAATWWFRTGGYRASLALLGTVMALLALAPWLFGLRWRTWLLAALLGMGLAAAALGAYAVVGKSSYVIFAVGFLVTLATIGWGHWRAGKEFGGTGNQRLAMLGLAGYAMVVLGTGLIYHHWGEGKNLPAAFVVLSLLLLVLLPAGLTKKPLWPSNLRWQAVVVGSMLMMLTLVAVFSGGEYIGSRFETGQTDLRSRLLHWQAGMNMLDDSEFEFGKGMGRYPASNLMNGPDAMRMGDYRVVQEESNAHLVLSGGRHPMDDGVKLRFSQRVSLPQADSMLSVDIRADADVALNFEVCPKHLLYAQYWSCPSAKLAVKGQPGRWQHFDLSVPTAKLSREYWYAPRLLAFSVAVATQGRVVALDNLHLRTTTEIELLANSDFELGLAHWFVTSDRYHLPWHIKNMAMNLVFDQGWVGLTLWLSLVALVLWRLSWGAAKDHPLAPTMAGAVVSFGVVGLFDSLLDVPRVAILFYFLLLVALTQHHPQSPQTNTRPE
ncbi:hypothetical protein HUU62_12730 [Rhodoferax sp. 4810]|nr:hypothetical protein [Rhodoferax jenense]